MKKARSAIFGGIDAVQGPHATKEIFEVIAVWRIISK
jgi:hypothetical protein